MGQDNYTERARKIISSVAIEEARRLGHEYVGTEHILLALIREGNGLGCKALQLLNIDLDVLVQEIEKQVKSPSVMPTLGNLTFNNSASKVLEYSREEAREFGMSYIGTEHLLLGLIRETDGIASQILESMGVTIENARQAVNRALTAEPSQPGVQPKRRTKTPALDAFGRDLTELAREGKLDPVIGRDDEIERVLQILCRRTKNNPVLLGEPGVGKTAIVEGIAQRIISQNAPDLLNSKRLLTLDLAAVVAGTKYRGQFEERMKAIMQEIRRSDDIILFIDELHTLIGAGAAEGAIDASNMLKPALSRGELQCIGATTLEEYRKFIERDGALERRFQTVNVDPPSVDDTLRILQGLRDKYEQYHGVTYTDESLETAAKLSDRYITGRYLPDKAIDLIDEAGARARLKSQSRPPDFKTMKQEIDRVVEEKQAAVKNDAFEKAAKLLDVERKLKTKYEAEMKQWEEAREKHQQQNQISEEDIAYIVSKWTGIPSIKLEQKESEKLLQMEAELQRRVIGQKEAILAVSKSIRRARAGLKNIKRPIGSFIFLGPTGVGKTELARALAQFLFDDEDALVRIDMSEYMEKFAVSRLVGAPPGYIGHDEGGQLTEKVRRRPYSVVLFDEIEKAHPDVFNILLQVLEDGRLTDSTGRTVDFRNCVVIMTSNLGTRFIHSAGGIGFRSSENDANYQNMKEKVLDELKKAFNPEFLNRVDEVVVFHQLLEEHIYQIIDVMLKDILERLKERFIKLVLTDDAKSFIVKHGYDPANGARPLRRALQRYIEDPLSEELLRGKFKDGDMILAELENDTIVFRQTDTPTPLEPAESH
jgi:ATP-dependent Clp protease ATP-binding subunit ClpC